MLSVRFELFLGIVLACIFQECFGAYINVKPNARSTWSYEGSTGPDYWCSMPGYEKCCKKTNKRQSPINIDTSTLTKMDTDLNFANYKTSPVAIDISNNGHTVVLGYKSTMSAIPTIAGGPLVPGNLYYLESIHFHWGPDAKTGGAEHLVDYTRYPMEMHMVHYNTRYNSTLQAEDYPNGLAVMSVLITIDKYPNPVFTELVNNLKNIRYKGQHKIIKTMVLANLLPESPAAYYTYEGSLTTPPCSPTVTWIVFTKAITMSKAQMNEFKKLQEDTQDESNGDNPIKKNFRPLQDLNYRQIKLWYAGQKGPIWGN